MVLARSLLYFVLLIATTGIYAVPVILLGALGREEAMLRAAVGWARANLALLRRVCGLSYQVDGLENVPEGGAVVMVKHQSAWETIALRALLPGYQTWVLKRELLWIPVFGWALRVARPIAIDRKSGRRAARSIVEQGTRRLREGRKVIIFPEGTRVPPGSRKKYGIGGGLLAAESGYPVLPVAHNAGVFWPRRSLRKYPGTVRVVIGPPLSSAGMSAAAITRRAEQWIEETVAGLPADRR